jgi:hypothetical protein
VIGEWVGFVALDPHLDCDGYDVVYLDGSRSVVHIYYDRSGGKVTEIRSGYARHPDGRTTDRFWTEGSK